MSRQDLSKLADIPKKKTLDSQMSDRKPIGLPFRLKGLRTFARFPIRKRQVRGKRLEVRVGMRKIIIKVYCTHDCGHC